MLQLRRPTETRHETVRPARRGTGPFLMAACTGLVLLLAQAGAASADCADPCATQICRWTGERPTPLAIVVGTAEGAAEGAAETAEGSLRIEEVLQGPDTLAAGDLLDLPYSASGAYVAIVNDERTVVDVFKVGGGRVSCSFPDEEQSGPGVSPEALVDLLALDQEACRAELYAAGFGRSLPCDDTVGCSVATVPSDAGGPSSFALLVGLTLAGLWRGARPDRRRDRRCRR